MRGSRTALFTAMAIVAGQYAMAQSGASVFPAKLEAGSAFSAVFPGTGKATLYIVGPEGAVKRDVELGASTIFPSALSTTPVTIWHSSREGPRTPPMNLTLCRQASPRS